MDMNILLLIIFLLSFLKDSLSIVFIFMIEIYLLENTNDFMQEKELLECLVVLNYSFSIRKIYIVFIFSPSYTLMSTSRKFMRQIKSFWSLHFQLPHFLYQNYAVIELVLCWNSKISISVQRVRNNIVSSFHVSYKLFPLDIQKDSKQ